MATGPTGSDSEFTRTHDDLRRRLKNARSRAIFWSGRPSFNGRGFVGNSGRGDDQYQLAMEDVRRLCTAIERLTGRRPKQSDPKGEFRADFSKLISIATKPSREFPVNPAPNAEVSDAKRSLE